MKKILALCALVSVIAFSTSAQNNVPRNPYEKHTLSNGSQLNSRISYQLHDATGTDTVFLNPEISVYENIIVLNDSTPVGGIIDTLHATAPIYLGNVTRNNIKCTLKGCYKYDKITIYVTDGKVAHSIKLMGAFGVGGAGYTLSTGTTVGKLEKFNLVFDGANFIQY